MGALTVRWALLSKRPGSPYDYEITATSHPAQRDAFTKILSEFTSGTSDPSALPRVSTSYFTETRDGRNIPMVGLSLQERSGELDRFGREFTTTKFVCSEWTDFHQAQASYLSLYRAIGAADLSALGPFPLTLELDPYPVDILGARVTPLVRQTAALLLTRQQICVTGADHLPTEGRLGFLDAVAALLPYGFRSSLAVSTWTSSSVRHRFKLSFAAVAPTWADELRWSEEGSQVEPPIELPGNKRYGVYVADLNGLKDRPLLKEVVAALQTVAEPLSLKHQADLDRARTLLVTAVTQARVNLTPRSLVTEPLVTEPLVTEPLVTEPAVEEFAAVETTVTEPMTMETPTAEPVPSLPMFSERATTQPATSGNESPPFHAGEPVRLDGLGERPAMTLDELITAGFAGLKAGDWQRVEAATQACESLKVTESARLRARNAIRWHASAFRMDLSGDAGVEFVRVALQRVYGAEPTALDIDHLAGDLGDKPHQTFFRAFREAFRPTPAGEILLTCFLYSDNYAVKRCFTARQIIMALAEEGHRRLLEVALLALQKTTAGEARELLHKHDFLISAVESTARKSRYDTYRFLLGRAYVEGLTTADLDDMVKHIGYPPDCLMRAIRDTADDDVDWDAVFVHIRGAVTEPANATAALDAGGSAPPPRLAARAWSMAEARARRLPRWTGWCATALMTTLFVASLLWDSGSAPGAGQAKTVPPTVPITSSGAFAAPSPVVTPSPSATESPLMFSWPQYTASPEMLRADPKLEEWIIAINRMDCRAIGRLAPARGAAAGVYAGLEAACGSTTAGDGNDHWRKAQAAADAERKIRDADCKDELAARLLTRLTDAHRANPHLTVRSIPQPPTPLACATHQPTTELGR